MKIGILTITPNVGFGGILQAYALKTILSEITESEVEIIQYRPFYSLMYRLKFFLGNLKKLILQHQFVKLSPEAELAYKCSKVSRFHQKYLSFSKKVTPGKPLVKYINENYDIVVVGSDQVWRPKYVSSIYDFFFKGVNKNIIKMSYAASLGVDNWEYNTQETELCGLLLKEFSYVSVREKSAIGLLRHQFKYKGDIHWVLDPTLLLRVEDYRLLFSSRKPDQAYVFSYVLDNNETKSRLVNVIGHDLKRNVLQFNTNGENSKVSLKDRVAPTVEEWLSGIYYSDFVVTDSFHGCVFAINFNKPFIVCVNKERGSDRFVSILGLLGLQNRMIYNLEEYNYKTAIEPIDWENVNAILKASTQDALLDLKSVLLN